MSLMIFTTLMMMDDFTDDSTLLTPYLGVQDGWTPLHTAASRGHKDCVLLLLDFQANVDHPTKVWTGAVVWRGTQYQPARLCLSPVLGLPAPCTAPAPPHLQDCLTPLHCACKRNQKDMAMLLILRGANVDATSKVHTKCTCALSYKVSPTLSHPWRHSALTAHAARPHSSGPGLEGWAPGLCGSPPSQGGRCERQ